MKIKLFTKDNLDECSQIYAEIFSSDPWNEPWTIDFAKKRLSELLLRPNFIAYISFATNGNISGFIGGNIESWCDGKTFLLEELFIDKKYQRKGIGTKMIKFLEKELKSKKVLSMYLKTKKDSFAEKFYTSNFFQSDTNTIYMYKNL